MNYHNDKIKGTRVWVSRAKPIIVRVLLQAIPARIRLAATRDRSWAASHRWRGGGVNVASRRRPRPDSSARGSSSGTRWGGTGVRTSRPPARHHCEFNSMRLLGKRHTYEARGVPSSEGSSRAEEPVAPRLQKQGRPRWRPQGGRRRREHEPRVAVVLVRRRAAPPRLLGARLGLAPPHEGHGRGPARRGRTPPVAVRVRDSRVRDVQSTPIAPGVPQVLEEVLQPVEA